MSHSEDNYEDGMLGLHDSFQRYMEKVKWSRCMYCLRDDYYTFLYINEKTIKYDFFFMISIIIKAITITTILLTIVNCNLKKITH